jgi:hypothetical protein
MIIPLRRLHGLGYGKNKIYIPYFLLGGKIELESKLTYIYIVCFTRKDNIY